MSYWTAERMAELRERWTRGETASTIAAALGGGVSRTAVIGKAYRMKLCAATSRPAPDQEGGR